MFKWGLVPKWAKDPSAIKSAFNARAETVASKPMFRTAFRSSRILVPVDAFYEWQTLAPKVKQPYAFQRADGDPIMFAGLREWWRDAEGHELNTATIITTEAGPDMPIHNRQPVVLERAQWDFWLDPSVTDVEKLQPLLAPTVEGTLIRHPVSKDVGNVRNNGPEMVEAIVLGGPSGPGPSDEGSSVIGARSRPRRGIRRRAGSTRSHGLPPEATNRDPVRRTHRTGLRVPVRRASIPASGHLARSAA